MNSTARLLLALSLAAFATTVSMISLAVAVPAIAREWHLGQDQVHWATSGFMLAMLPGMLATPALLQRWGERRTCVGALLLALAGAAASSLAPAFGALVAARMLEGLAAGVLHPLPVIAVSRRVQASRRGRAMGAFSVGFVLAPTIAPLLGGALVQAFGWRAVPLASLPFALLALVGTGALSGPDGAHGAAPRVPPRAVLAVAAFRRACGVAFLYGAALFASSYLMPVFVQLALHHPPATAGAVLLPAGLTLVFTSPWGGRAADRWPRHRVMAAGFVVLSLPHLATHLFDAATPLWPLVLLLVATRLGMALVLPSISLEALRELPAEGWSTGSSLVSAARQLGAAVGIGAESVFLQWRLGATSADNAFAQAFAIIAAAGLAAAWLAWRNAPQSAGA